MGACVSSPKACVGVKPRSSEGVSRKRRRKKRKSELKSVAGSSNRSSERGDCYTASVADSARAPGLCLLICLIVYLFVSGI